MGPWVEGGSSYAKTPWSFPTETHKSIDIHIYCIYIYSYTIGGGFKYFLCSPYLGKIPILTNIFSKGLKPPTSILEMYIYI